MAGETATVTRDRHLLPSGRMMSHIIVSWLSDDGDGTCSCDIAAGLGEDLLYGFLYAVKALPGATAPDTGFDVTLDDPNNLDIAAAGLANVPVPGGLLWTPTTPIALMNEVTMEITNANNAKTGTLELFIEE